MYKILFLLLTIPALTFAAGNDQGNGGVGILCKTFSGIKSVELFDIYEGRVLLGLNPVKTDSNFKEVAKETIKKFSQLYNDQDREKWLNLDLDYVLQNMKMLPSGVGLTLTQDVENFIKPKHCDIVQILNFRNDGQIFIDSELWRLLDPTQKAAALVHETIYRHLRKVSTLYRNAYGVEKVLESNSVRVRKIVAHLFSGNSLETLGTEKAGANETRIKCTNYQDPMVKIFGETEFVLLKENKEEVSHTKARFNKISNQLMLSRSEVIFDLEDGLQNLALNSLIDKGIEFEFFGTPDFEKLKNNATINVVIKDSKNQTSYTSSFECFDYK